MFIILSEDSSELNHIILRVICDSLKNDKKREFNYVVYHMIRSNTLSYLK